MWWGGEVRGEGGRGRLSVVGRVEKGRAGEAGRAGLGGCRVSVSVWLSSPFAPPTCTWLSSHPTWLSSHPTWLSSHPTWLSSHPTWLSSHPTWLSSHPTWLSSHPTWLSSHPTWLSSHPTWLSSHPTWLSSHPTWLSSRPTWSLCFVSTRCRTWCSWASSAGCSSRTWLRSAASPPCRGSSGLSSPGRPPSLQRSSNRWGGAGWGGAVRVGRGGPAGVVGCGGSGWGGEQGPHRASSRKVWPWMCCHWDSHWISTQTMCCCSWEHWFDTSRDLAPHPTPNPPKQPLVKYEPPYYPSPIPLTGPPFPPDLRPPPLCASQSENSWLWLTFLTENFYLFPHIRCQSMDLVTIAFACGCVCGKGSGEGRGRNSLRTQHWLKRVLWPEVGRGSRFTPRVSPTTWSAGHHAASLFADLRQPHVWPSLRQHVVHVLGGVARRVVAMGTRRVHPASLRARQLALGRVERVRPRHAHVLRHRHRAQVTSGSAVTTRGRVRGLFPWPTRELFAENFPS